MNRKEINSWWRKAIDKERVRHMNSGKGHKGDKFSVPTDFSNFAPPLKSSKDAQ